MSVCVQSGSGTIGRNVNVNILGAYNIVARFDDVTMTGSLVSRYRRSLSSFSSLNKSSIYTTVFFIYVKVFTKKNRYTTRCIITVYLSSLFDVHLTLDGHQFDLQTTKLNCGHERGRGL